MEENIDDAGLDQRTKDKINKEIAEAVEEKQLKQKWRMEIEKSEAIQDYFQLYNSISIPTFIDWYLTTKYLAYKHKTFYAEKVERMRTQWIDEAHQHLEAILQKKLFDLQCL